jgi:hypothetical protein
VSGPPSDYPSKKDFGTAEGRRLGGVWKAGFETGGPTGNPEDRSAPRTGQKIRERSIRFSLEMEAIHFLWPELRFRRFATTARTFADPGPGSYGIGNFSSGAGKCLSTIGCWRHLFLVQECPVLSDKLRLKQSSVILSALAQKMLSMTDICWVYRAGFMHLTQTISRVSFQEKRYPGRLLMVANQLSRSVR